MRFKFWKTKDVGATVPNSVEEVEEFLYPDAEAAVQFPHCDSLILHSPGACEYCDMHPDWQMRRLKAGIAFSDTDEEVVRKRNLIPCPSTNSRPAEVRDRWYGNVPKRGTE